MLPVAILVCHFLRHDGVEGDADEKIGKCKVFLLFRQFGGGSSCFNACVYENALDGALADIGIGGDTLNVFLCRDYLILIVGHGSIHV